MVEEKRKVAVRARSPKRQTPKPREVKLKKDRPRVSPADVELVETRGTAGKGGNAGGHSWIIKAGGVRAGVIYINLIDEPPLGKHASIQIFLNKKSQGRGIGRVAYGKASAASEYDVIYAHMRKTNVPSRRAAEEAGYVNASPAGFVQLIMRWDRRAT
jgi:hypothetical protein